MSTTSEKISSQNLKIVKPQPWQATYYIIENGQSLFKRKIRLIWLFNVYLLEKMTDTQAAALSLVFYFNLAGADLLTTLLLFIHNL